MERFIDILIEHYAGKLPLWLAPRQIVLATIIGDADGCARDVHAALNAAGLRAELDLRHEKFGYKIREHSLAKVPVLLVVGRREAQGRQVAVRRLGESAQPVLALGECVSALAAELNRRMPRPVQQSGWTDRPTRPSTLNATAGLRMSGSPSNSYSAPKAEYFGNGTCTPAYHESRTCSGVGRRDLSRVAEAAGGGGLYASPIQPGEPVTRKQAWRETAAPALPARHSS